MLRFYHEAFALTPKLWCSHISFYSFDGWVGVGGVGGLIISISMFVLLLKPRQYSPHISRKY